MKRTLLIILAALCLVGCNSLNFKQINASAPENYLTWQQRLSQLQQIKGWYCEGAISIIQTDGKNTIAHFNWRNETDRYNLNIYGPLHLANITISGDQHLVQLLRQDGSVVTAISPEYLMYKQLGWTIPVGSLRYWILGMPAPKFSYEPMYTTSNYLSYLQQQGWRIWYLAYQTVNGVALPTKIELINYRLHIKAVINQWELNR